LESKRSESLQMFTLILLQLSESNNNVNIRDQSLIFKRFREMKSYSIKSRQTNIIKGSLESSLKIDSHEYNM
jgi:hypothetical protein